MESNKLQHLHDRAKSKAMNDFVVKSQKSGEDFQRIERDLEKDLEDCFEEFLYTNEEHEVLTLKENINNIFELSL